jgi:hypothetical protein
LTRQTIASFFFYLNNEGLQRAHAVFKKIFKCKYVRHSIMSIEQHHLLITKGKAKLNLH